MCFIVLSSLFLSCTKNVQVATVKVEGGKNAALFLDTTDSCRIRAVEVSEETGRLAVLNGLNDLYVWDTNTGKADFIVSLGSHVPAMMKFSPDGSMIATCGLSDGRIRFLDSRDGSVIREIKDVTETHGSCCFGSDQGDAVNAIEFTPDGSTIVSADSKGNIKYWRVSDGSFIEAFNWHPQQSTAYNLRFDSRGEYLAVAGGETHFRQEARTGSRTYCCRSGKNGCESYCTETYTYYVTVAYYYPIVKIFRRSPAAVVAHDMYSREGVVHDMEFTGDGSFIASNNSGQLLLFNTAKPDEGFDRTPGFISQVEDFHAGGRIITAYAGEVSVRNMPHTKSGIYIKTGEKNITILKYFKRGGIILLSGGDTVRFWNTKGDEMGLLSTTGKGNWVFVKSDGYYDGTEQGCGELYWKIGEYTITMKEFGEGFSRPGVMAGIFEKGNEQDSFDVASRLVGKIGQVGSGEILVYAPESSGLKMGEKLFVIIDKEKVILEVVYPMMTTAKCRLSPEHLKYRQRIKSGMPVFR